MYEISSVHRPWSAGLAFCLLSLLAAVACSRTDTPPNDGDAVSACRQRLPEVERSGSRTTVGTAADGAWRVRIWTGPGSGTVGPPQHECRVIVRRGQVVVTAFDEDRR